MVSATDLLTLYIGLELNSLAAYVLASFARTDGRSAEAGLKYFVLGALASGILLFGMSLIYGFTGSTDFHAIGNAMSGEIGMGLLLGLIFVLSGLAFKISAAPFHMWTPDVYEGAPTPVTAFFASAPKVAASALVDPHHHRSIRQSDRCVAADHHRRLADVDHHRCRWRNRAAKSEAPAGL